MLLEFSDFSVKLIVLHEKVYFDSSDNITRYISVDKFSEEILQKIFCSWNSSNISFNFIYYLYFRLYYILYFRQKDSNRYT